MKLFAALVLGVASATPAVLQFKTASETCSVEFDGQKLNPDGCSVGPSFVSDGIGSSIDGIAKVICPAQVEKTV
jgi:hypothetical protein